MFGGKPASVVGPERSFSQTQLTAYVESLIRECNKVSMSRGPNYIWLRSRNVKPTVIDDIDYLDGLAQKVSPERRAAIAVKLDALIEENTEMLADLIVDFYRQLLEEEYRCQLVAVAVEQKKKIVERRVRLNKVSPELYPPGRQATVSFIFQNDIEILDA